VNEVDGRAIAQAVVARLPPHWPGFELRSNHLEFVVDKVALGQVSFDYFGFRSPILVPPNAQYSCTIRDWYSRPLGGRRTGRTQSHPTPQNLKIKLVVESYTVCHVVIICMMSLYKKSFELCVRFMKSRDYVGLI
jgi:hypothetical protein